MKIAIVEHVGGHGGMEFYDFELCEALMERGVMPCLYTCDETGLGNRTNIGFKVMKTYKKIYVGSSKVLRGWRFLKGAFTSSIDAKRNLCRVVHFHIFHFSWLEYINMWIFKRKGFRIVATVHDVESFTNSPNALRTRSYRKFERVIDRVIVHTRYAQQRLHKHFSDYPSEHIHYILPLDFDRVFKTNVSGPEARNALNLPMSGRMILFFGQIKEVKGLDVLLEAFRLLVEAGEDVYLVIAGRKWQVDFDKYERYIKENGLTDRIVMRINYIANDLVPLYFRSADMVVLPYRKIFNSSVLQRALDYGTPSIVSDLEPLTEIIQDGTNGLVFPVGDYRELVKKMSRLIHDKDLCIQLAARGRETVEVRYNYARIGKQTKQVYEDALL